MQIHYNRKSSNTIYCRDKLPPTSFIALASHDNPDRLDRRDEYKLLLNKKGSKIKISDQKFKNSLKEMQFKHYAREWAGNLQCAQQFMRALLYKKVYGTIYAHKDKSNLYSSH